MQTPMQITFRDMPVSDAVEARCWEEAEKLERYCDRITACHITIAASHHRHRQGNLYEVRISLAVPGTELVVNREPPAHHEDEDIEVALRETFDRLRRRLQEYVHRMRGEVKSHDAPPIGRIIRIVTDGGYGFIEAADGHEVYFHRNSVRQGHFGGLEVGTEVRFIEEPGHKGPQAVCVTPVGIGNGRIA